MAEHKETSIDYFNTLDEKIKIRRIIKEKNETSKETGLVNKKQRELLLKIYNLFVKNVERIIKLQWLCFYWHLLK